MSDGTSSVGDLPLRGLSKTFERLSREILQILLPTPVRQLDPAQMTDKELQLEIHDVGGRLLNALGPILQRSFTGEAVRQDLQFRHPMPFSPRGHVLFFFTCANDSFGLALRGLNAHATAAALGPIRNIAETLALMKWLLEDPASDVILSRAHRLTLNVADEYKQQREALERVAEDSAQKREYVAMLAAAERRLRKSVAELAEQDGVAVAGRHGSMSSLIEQYLPDYGGYMFYSLLSRSGVHPSAARSLLFYGKPGTGVVDFDFKGLFHVRAYWIGQAIRLHLELCQLVAPVLGWQESEGLAAETRRQLAPLAQEAELRFIEPLRRAVADYFAENSLNSEN